MKSEAEAWGRGSGFAVVVVARVVVVASVVVVVAGVVVVVVAGETSLGLGTLVVPTVVEPPPPQAARTMTAPTAHARLTGSRSVRPFGPSTGHPT